MLLRFVLFFLVASSSVSFAADRAVLVGVSDYLYLDADLEGPANDVGLMAEVLILRGIEAENIVVLAEETAAVPDGVTRGLPDKASVLAALDAAILATSQGDRVVFYFSGHGAQAPDSDGDEGGGMDEIFLPRDAKGWNGGTGAVENAIVDDELSQFTELAARRGVKLIGIIDACHSGTGFRAGPQDHARARYIAPATLGIPEAPAGGQAVSEDAPPGEYVFLYAAQSDQRAFEYPIGPERRWHGDFTRALTEVMQEVPDLSYVALVEAAAARMRTVSGQAAQTPDVEGPLADTAVFGGDGPGLSRMAVDGQTLKAGLLRGVTKGSTLTLFADLLAKEPAGTATVTTVRATDADLEYLAPFPTVKVTHAALSERAVDTSVILSFTQGAAEQLGDMAAFQARLDVPIDADAPTHLVAWDDTEFVLTGADGIIDAAGPGSSIRLGTGDLDTLAESLRRAVGRVRLEKALFQMGGGKTTGFSLAQSGPEIGFDLAKGRSKGRSCRRASGAGNKVVDTAAADHCDVLSVTFNNATAKMQDVTILYINNDNSIDTIWPAQNLSNRIDPGAQRRMQFALVADRDRALTETLIVVAVPAEPGSPRTRLAFLGGGGPPAYATGAVASYLTSVSDPAETRGFTLKPKGANLHLARLGLTISPRSSGDTE